MDINKTRKLVESGKMGGYATGLSLMKTKWPLDEPIPQYRPSWPPITDEEWEVRRKTFPTYRQVLERDRRERREKIKAAVNPLTLWKRIKAYANKIKKF